ncbi:acyl-CoA dehydrogenase family protein [Paraburkholderia saeva]|uniref:Crotonobetainyl-CoA reductase n=1 Tax=Paraburkholderia saeva TaxID=2777537 RepID=A0A9N8RZX5_9BURK|nr:acyl-CoA dehydrogenase family protein [Paraburkholderia saeva]CAG4889807.1 Crotonobetainyl-CoA reductase [Paraburkholderia saeva]CAG4913199.1 Crotonobetainyl-CoA reductase [Paraburkholderia saeva]
MFTEAIEAILRDYATPEAIRAIEKGGAASPLWNALEEAGFLALLTPESAGGAGLSLPVVAPVFTALGRYALPLPFAQSIAARALLHDAVPGGMTTLAGACRRRADGALEASHVPFGMLCDHVLANVDGELVLLDATRAERKPCGVHGSAAGTLSWRAAAVPGAFSSAGEAVLLFSAAIHAAAIAGAMDRVFGMTLQYCNDRSQFGKSIGKFQAVQHQLSVMAQHVASAAMAAELAFSGEGVVPERLATAIAKARTSMAVPLVASTAHALHGAIGVTAEYDLQLFTRRMHEWRMADGSEAFWNRMVGNALLTQEYATIADFARTAPYGNAA